MTWRLPFAFFTVCGTIIGACDSIDFEGDPGEDVLSSFAYEDYDTDGVADVLASGYAFDAFDGLQCVLFDSRAETGWKFELINFAVTCTYGAAPWAGTATLGDDGALAVTATWQSEYPNGCGSVLSYFDYLLEPFELGAALDYDVTIRSCTGESCDGALTYGGSIATSAEGAALSCRYVVGSSAEGVYFSDGGGRYNESQDGFCGVGLVPRVVQTDLDPDLELCLPACETTTDCPWPAVETCDGGSCIIANPLELTGE